MASSTEITMFRGEKVTLQVAVTDDVGVAKNITGASIYFAVRSQYPAASIVADTDATIKKSVGSGITITSALAGIFSIVINKADTVSLDTYGDLRMFYRLEIVLNGETEPEVIAQGSFILKPDVVRAA